MKIDENKTRAQWIKVELCDLISLSVICAEVFTQWFRNLARRGWHLPINCKGIISKVSKGEIITIFCQPFQFNCYNFDFLHFQPEWAHFTFHNWKLWNEDARIFKGFCWNAYVPCSAYMSDQIGFFGANEGTKYAQNKDWQQAFNYEYEWCQIMGI